MNISDSQLYVYCALRRTSLEENKWALANKEHQEVSREHSQFDWEMHGYSVWFKNAFMKNREKIMDYTHKKIKGNEAIFCMRTKISHKIRV